MEAVEGLYSERLKVGAVSVMTENKSEAEAKKAEVKGAVEIIPELSCRGTERGRVLFVSCCVIF